MILQDRVLCARYVGLMTMVAGGWSFRDVDAEWWVEVKLGLAGSDWEQAFGLCIKL